jgi:hypothetical protein
MADIGPHTDKEKEVFEGPRIPRKRKSGNDDSSLREKAANSR